MLKVVKLKVIHAKLIRNKNVARLWKITAIWNDPYYQTSVPSFLLVYQYDVSYHQIRTFRVKSVNFNVQLRPDSENKICVMYWPSCVHVDDINLASAGYVCCTVFK